jgi:hypothetical protein
MVVPSMCLLIKDSTLVAVVWRCGLVAAHLRAYSPTVTGFASLTYAPDNLAPSTAARCRSASALRANVRDARGHQGRASARGICDRLAFECGSSDTHPPAEIDMGRKTRDPSGQEARERFACAAVASVGRRAVPAKPRRPPDGTVRDGPLGSRLGRRPYTASCTRCGRVCPTFPRHPSATSTCHGPPAS